jgi:hypothetical protein
MNDVLDQVERQLVGAIRAHLASRRARRRRRVLALAAAGALLLAVSGASAISGDGPIAEVLGVDRNDPTLRSVQEVRDAPRAVVRVRGPDGHMYTFAGFHVREGMRRREERAVCTTQARDDHTRVSGIGCIPSDALAKALRRHGLVGGPTWGGSQAGSLRVTVTASGLVPADVRRVTMAHGSEPAVEAKLSAPIPVSLERRTSPPRMRAFLAVSSFDNDGADWLAAPMERAITVTLADGTTKRQSDRMQGFFPMVDSSGPESELVVMRHPGTTTPWRSVSYRGKRGTLCNSAAPEGERLIRIGLLQCSAPLAVINALTRYGAALYLSNFDPRRERGRRTVAVFGFTRSDTRAITLVDRRGRRYGARLSRPWTTVVRRDAALAGIDGELRRRLERLPRRVRVRSYIASLDVPPEPGDAGLRLVVELKGGKVLRTGAG